MEKHPEEIQPPTNSDLRSVNQRISSEEDSIYQLKFKNLFLCSKNKQRKRAHGPTLHHANSESRRGVTKLSETFLSALFKSPRATASKLYHVLFPGPYFGCVPQNIKTTSSDRFRTITRFRLQQEEHTSKASKKKDELEVPARTYV